MFHFITVTIFSSHYLGAENTSRTLSPRSVSNIDRCFIRSINSVLLNNNHSALRTIDYVQIILVLYD